jgi:hypothetical protein
MISSPVSNLMGMILSLTTFPVPDSGFLPEVFFGEVVEDDDPGRYRISS